MWEHSQFYVGQLVVHRHLNYRGVVVDVDPRFRENDAWSETETAAGSAHGQPWYRVLPDGVAHEAYVAQRSLVPDESSEKIRHPLLWLYFSDFRDGAYVRAVRSN